MNMIEINFVNNNVEVSIENFINFSLNLDDIGSNIHMFRPLLMMAGETPIILDDLERLIKEDKMGIISILKSFRGTYQLFYDKDTGDMDIIASGGIKCSLNDLLKLKSILTSLN